jgi:acetyltransferase-like isoleucine patch superfamily enzyme
MWIFSNVIRSQDFCLAIMSARAPVLLTKKVIDDLQHSGVNTLHPPGRVRFPFDSIFEPPCSIKWLTAEYSIELGAFSYGVSGYFFACSIGRYCSFGELVQMGRHSHPLDFISTSPIFYHHSDNVLGVLNHDALISAPMIPSRPPTSVKPTVVGNDVYIGHGAFILPGVRIGDGAVIGACSVVTKDVPPYAIVAGSPATIKRYRFKPTVIADLLMSRWWEYSPAQLGRIDPAQPEAFVAKAKELRTAKIPEYQPAKISLGSILNQSAQTL